MEFQGYLRRQSKKTPSEINKLPTVIKDIEYRDEDGKLQRRTTYWDIEDTIHDRFIITFFLECDRYFCKEIVATCGITKLEKNYAGEDENRMPYEELNDSKKPISKINKYKQ